jgi:hypothetical protein
MQYIRVHEIEQLLRLYHDLVGMSQSIRLQLDTIKDNEVTDDDLASLALHHATFDDIPSYSKGYASDKTSKVALNYEKALNFEVQQALRELQEDLQLIEIIIAKLDIALSVLPDTHKEIVLLRYCKGLKWDVIDNTVNKNDYLMSISAMKARGKEGIDRICVVSRISINAYQATMQLFNFEEDEG